MTESDIFVIEDGTLVKYRGNDARVVIPNGVIEISFFAFEDCNGVTEVVIPDGAVMLDFSAFCMCKSLERIFIPASLTEVGPECPITDCPRMESIVIDPKNTSFASVDGVWYSRDMTRIIYYPQGRTQTSFALQQSVACIGCGAFSGNEHLEAVTIPAGLKTIEADAFRDCAQLSTAIIPRGVTTIGSHAFAGCKKLSGLDIIPDSTRAIGFGAFCFCGRIETVRIPDGVTEIPDFAFAHCTWLLSVIIPRSVTKIGQHAFLGCPLLLSITLPDSITEIGKAALGFEGTGFTLRRVHGFAIYGRKGSAAALYTELNGFRFAEEQ